jgi:hypothetical protein
MVDISGSQPGDFNPAPLLDNFSPLALVGSGDNGLPRGRQAEMLGGFFSPDLPNTLENSIALASDNSLSGDLTSSTPGVNALNRTLATTTSDPITGADLLGRQVGVPERDLFRTDNSFLADRIWGQALPNPPRFRQILIEDGFLMERPFWRPRPDRPIPSNQGNMVDSPVTPLPGIEPGTPPVSAPTNTPVSSITPPLAQLPTPPAVPPTQPPVGTTTAITNFTPLIPNAIVFQASSTGTFAAANQTDTYTLNLRPDEPTTVAITLLDPSLQARVNYYASAGDLATTNSFTGTWYYEIQPSGATIPSQPYQLDLTSLQGAGQYKVQVFSNASLEEEIRAGQSNDTLPQAELLTNSGKPDLGERTFQYATIGRAEAGGTDYYLLYMLAGQSTNLNLLAPTSGLNLQILDTDGNVLINGISGNSGVAIQNYIALKQGFYYVRVSSQTQEQYSLVSTLTYPST